MSSKESRRSFLNWLTSLPLIGAFIGFMGSAIVFLWPPRQSRNSGLREIGSVEEYQDENGVILTLEGSPILLLKKEGRCTAFSASCTHLGCPVRWRAKERDIFCSCHGAVFDTEGNPVKGPAKLPLKPFPLKVIGERLYIDLA